MTIDLPFVFDPKPSLNPISYFGRNVLSPDTIEKWILDGFAVYNVAPHANTVRVNRTIHTGRLWVFTWIFIALHRNTVATTPDEIDAKWLINRYYDSLGGSGTNLPLRIRDIVADTNLELKIDMNGFLFAVVGGPFALQCQTLDISVGGTVSYRGSVAGVLIKGDLVPGL